MIAQLFIQVHSFNRHLLSALHLAGLTQYREETNRRFKKKKKGTKHTQEGPWPSGSMHFSDICCEHASEPSGFRGDTSHSEMLGNMKLTTDGGFSFKQGSQRSIRKPKIKL